MSNTSQCIAVTVKIVEGVAAFSYSPPGTITVTETTDVIFTLSNTCSPSVSFESPLVAYVPVDESRDITPSVSSNGQVLTLIDTDVDKETICVQLVVKDTYGNSYASPDPRIVNKPR
ncbi:MAG: hypothetical protein ACI936_003794 [Paraglaciecola sp.]|jgi:hypothetical protein